MPMVYLYQCLFIFHQIRVAVVPYNDHAFRVIDFDSYGSKDELLTELGKITQAQQNRKNPCI